MIGSMASSWNEKMHAELPGKWTPHNEKIRNILEDYFHDIEVTAEEFEKSLPSYLA